MFPEDENIAEEEEEEEGFECFGERNIDSKKCSIPVYKNDSTKDDLPGDASIEQSRFQRGPGATSDFEAGASIELLRRCLAGRH